MSCDICKHVTRSDNLERHKTSTQCKVSCGLCKEMVPSKLIEEHKQVHAMNLNIGVTNDSCSLESPGFSQEPEVEIEFRDIYSTFEKYISTKQKKGKLMDRHNVRLSCFSTHEIIHHFKIIFRQQASAFKVNMSLGVILQNKKTGEYRFNWSSQNNQLLLDKPRFIRNSTDKHNLINVLKGMDLIEKVSRPSSAWIFVKATNIEFFIYKMNNTPIGSAVELPDHLMNNKGLNALCKDYLGKPFNDNLCFFRCLALHQGSTRSALVKPVKKLLATFLKTASIKEFDGIYLEQLEDVSRIFNVPINVYTQNEERTTHLIFRSTLENGKVLNLNLFNDHFSYIQDLEKYSQSYRCRKCDKIWNHAGNFHRHVKSCSSGVKEYFKGGAFQLKKTIFEELEDHGIHIRKEDRDFPYRAAFDIECILKKATVPNTSKVEYSYEHELVSISVCSNVPGYKKPKCFVLKKEGRQKELAMDMIKYLLEISDASSALLREKYQDYMEQIENPPLKEKF